MDDSSATDGASGSLDFLSGGGEMGACMRSLDWRTTPLGDPLHWPSSLRSTVGIMLNSKYPMFLAWGPELAFLYNDGYMPILGDKHPEALGRPFPRIWSEIWEDIRPLVDRALAGEPTWSEDLQLFMERRGFPEEVYFTFSYSPVRGDGGAVEGMFCACTETTVEVTGRRRLKTMRDLAAATADARDVEEVCTSAARIFEEAAEDVPFSLLYLLDGGVGGARLAAWSGCRPGEANSPYRVSVQAPGAECWPHHPVLPESGATLTGIDGVHGLPGGPWPEPASIAAILPLAGGQDDLWGYLVLGASPRLVYDEPYSQFFDLLGGGLAGAMATARARENDRQRAEALAEIDRAKTLFFSNISHEFRTPLTLILAPLLDALAEADELPGPLREELALAHRNSRRLLKLVNALLDFSRIEAGRMDAWYEPTNLAELTADLASNFRSACERAGLTLNVVCPPLDEPVFVDRDMWEKIVLNLLSNAFKFTMAGEIEVRLEAVADQAVLQVRDTGAGIPPDELPRLFERFHRIEQTRGRTHEGSGIGLALVRELVNLHGGHIEAHSEPGSGTTFTVRLPLGSAHLPPDRIGEASASVDSGEAAAYVEEALRWLPEEPAEVTAPSPSGAGRPEWQHRVLIADDNADMRGYLVRLLRPHWNVEVAENGRQALEAARRNPPDLVLADVMMPVLDGFAMIRALRAEPRTAAVPVILLSARAGEESRIEGLEAGADDYLVKPFNARELVARVSSQLALAQSARERTRLADEARTAHKLADLQRQHLQTLFMQAPAPVVVLRGPDHVVELANGPACRVWGRTIEEVVDRPLLDALPELRGQVFEELLQQVYESGRAHVGKETRATLQAEADAEPRDVYFNFVYAPLHDIAGTIDGVLVMAFDVTDQVLAREHTETLRRQAEEASRAKDEFLAILGHEMRNPLAPIMTALELMRMRGGNAFATERALIERQARQLVSLVDDLMDVSRIAQGKIEFKLEPVDVPEVVQHALEMVSPLLEQRRHELEMDFPERELRVRGDFARLAQVVSNLLSNAAKYTDPGGRIRVTAQRRDGDVVLRVTDNGTGIEPALLPRIFDMFAQQPQAMDRSLGGLGLGLTIVRSIVEQHGGKVEARSEGEGHGSEFVVRLPALEGSATTSHSAAASSRSAERPVRVLVVDDNADAAVGLAEFLSVIGHDVRIAHDAPQALRVAQTFVPQAGLLDIGLPGMDGYELASRLVAGAGAQPPMLIAVSGYGHDRQQAQPGDQHFAEHLVKPVDLDRLADLLADLQTDRVDDGRS